MSSSGHPVLIIDDELHICQKCVKILAKEGYGVEYVLNGHEALKRMEARQYHVIVTDLKMASMGGMEVLRRVKKAYPDTLVVVITGYATVSSAVEVMKTGAHDYLPKPFTPDELRAVVRGALEERSIRTRNREMWQLRAQIPPSHQLIGSSPKIQTVIHMVRKVAPTDSTVLIYGESGTGKELVARAIHANSNRKDKVFFAVDCGTLTGNLLESELFGHRKGAFTGADRDKNGILHLAERGTVFLDEISNISVEVQGKLLRFLETREFLPVGATKVERVDIRLVLATNRDLKAMVEEGDFREDFFYRIYVYPINVPPLRERQPDILPIAYHFLAQFNQTMGKSVMGLDDEAVRRLTEYHWPGNVRQLRNAIERAVIVCEEDRIGLQDLDIGDAVAELAEQVPSTNEEFKRLKKEIRQKAVWNMERNFLLHALIQSSWNVAEAARRVGLQRTNFQNLMKRHGIRRPDDRKGREKARP